MSDSLLICGSSQKLDINLAFEMPLLNEVGLHPTLLYDKCFRPVFFQMTTSLTPADRVPLTLEW